MLGDRLHLIDEHLQPVDIVLFHIVLAARTLNVGENHLAKFVETIVHTRLSSCRNGERDGEFVQLIVQSIDERVEDGSNARLMLVDMMQAQSSLTVRTCDVNALTARRRCAVRFIGLVLAETPSRCSGRVSQTLADRDKHREGLCFRLTRRLHRTSRTK